MKKLLLCLLLWTAGPVAAQTQSLSDSNPSVAVLPFRNSSSDPTLAWLADAIGETLSTRLPALAAVRVVERTQVERLLKEIYFSQSALVDTGSGLEAGKLMSAQYMILGSYQLDAQTLWLQARLVRVETGQVMVSADAKGPRDQVLNLESELTEKLSQSLQGLNGQPPATVPLPVLPLDFRSCQALEKARILLRDLPRYELDPLRQRNQARYFQALEYLEQVLTENPNQVEALLLSGQVYLNLEQRDKALSYFQRAEGLAPNSAEPVFALGIYYKTGRDFAQALPALQKAQARNPHHAEAAYAAAVILHLLQRDEDALDALFRALSSQPGLQAAETLLQSILNAPIHNQPAATWLASQAGHSPACAAALLWLGFETQQLELGAPYLGQVLNTYPNLYRFAYDLGKLAQQQNRADMAQQLLQRSVSLYPVYAPSHLALGDLYFARQDCNQASRHYQLYLHLANSGERFGELRERIQHCGS